MDVLQQKVCTPHRLRSGNLPVRLLAIRPVLLPVYHPETIMPCFASHLTGERTLHHKRDVLEIVVLVNPSVDTVVSEVRWTLPDDEAVLEKKNKHS